MSFIRKSGASAWLGVAIISMAFMGVYAFLIVMARTPGISSLFTEQDFFRTGLVTHVVLAVVIWFLAFIMFVIHYVTGHRPTSRAELFVASLGLLGVGLIVATPFTGPANPTLNNYVPVLDRGLYFVGLSFFFAAVAFGFLMRAGELWRAPVPFIVRGSLLTAGFALLMALLSILIAWNNLAPHAATMDTRFYFESLFWGGGHTLQFANTLGLLAVWALLFSRMSDRPPLADRVAFPLLALVALFVVMAPVQYVMNDADSVDLRRYFLLLKGYGLSFGPLAVAFPILLAFTELRGDAVARRGLLISIFLFGLGGSFALLLDGSDTRVPAHYHGVIGAVTICFMAFGLSALADKGWLTVSEKWRLRQLTLYGAGQTLFVVGLFIGGSRGAQRKTFGTAQTLDDGLKLFGMSAMGLGGVLAISAGALFVFFMLKSFLQSRRVED